MRRTDGERLGLLTRLRRWWGRGDHPESNDEEPADESVQNRAPDAPATEVTAGGTGDRGGYDFDPAAIQSRADIVDVTGLTPEGFVRRLLEAENGRLSQQELVDATGMSASSVSRYLQDLEERGVVVRLEVGRSKVVFLPEAVPSARRSDAGSERRSRS